MSDKLIFPIGFDLDEGVKEASKQWKSTYRKQMQDAIDKNPIKVKIDFESKGIDTKEFKQWMVLSREAEKLERERIKNAKEWQKIADQQAMAETRRANAINESNARIERANRKAEASERRKANAIQSTNTEVKKQSNFLVKWGERLVAYRSILSAMSFLRNIRTVTAEFELQRVALGSVIKDLNEANKMFEQIKAAAVKSPFQVKELVSYSKQLAAYKIETDELFETTQRLADISAGLGVGMERLVLAYGQIRATGFLRASEVRQLTEAGVPIVEELAKKMSQLRGETVRASEVMQLISERAISFGMVKEVFDDMTSAGGMFYKMQEKQAETLAGQWSNLQDAVVIMYDEIGNTEGVNKSMKGLIGLFQSLAENWRVVSDIAQSTAVSLGGYALLVAPLSRYIKRKQLLVSVTKAEALAAKAAAVNNNKLFNEQLELSTSARKAAEGINILGKGLSKVFKVISSFFKANWIGILIAGITALVSWLISARQEANRLNKELEKIGTEGKLQAEGSVRNFERLASSLKSATINSQQYSSAIKELKRTYGELLPMQDEEIAKLIKTEAGYRSVAQAIREKTLAQTKSQEISLIESDSASKTQKEYDKLTNALKNSGLREFDGALGAFMNNVAQGIYKNLSNVALGKELGGLLNVDLSTIKGYNDIINALEKIVEVQNQYEDSIKKTNQKYESLLGNTDKFQDLYKDMQSELANYFAPTNTFEEQESKRNFDISTYKKYLQKMLDSTEFGDTFDLSKSIDIDFDGIIKSVQYKYPQLKSVIDKIRSEYEKLVPKGIDKLTREQMVSLANTYGASLDKIQFYFKDSEKSTQDWVKSLKDAAESLDQKIFEIDKQLTAGEGDSAALQLQRKELVARKRVFDETAKYWENSKSAAKSAMQLLKEEIATTEKMYKRYKELRKYMSESDAKSAIEKEFASVNLPKKLSVDDMLAYYQTQLAKAQKLGDKKLGDKKLVLEIQTKIGELNFSEFQEKIKSNLQRLKEQIAQSKEARQFYDKIFGLSGNRDLAMSVTLSVYGTTGDDLAQKTAEQLRNAFGKIDISDAINPNNFAIDWSKVRKLFEDNYGQMSDESKKIVQEMISNEQQLSKARIESWAKDLESVKSYADKRIALAEYTQKKIAKIEGFNVDDDKKQELINEYRKREAKETSKLQFEAFKDESFSNIFSNLEGTSTTMLENLRDNLIKFKSQLKDITEIKEVEESIQRINDQLASRNPFKTITESIATMKSLGSKSELEDALSSAIEKRDAAQSQFNLHLAQQTQYEEEYQSLLSQFGKDDARVKSAKKLVDLEKQNVQLSKDKLNSAEGEVDVNAKKYKQLTQSQQNIVSSLQQISQYADVATKSVNQIYNAFGNLMGDDIDAEFFNSIAGGLNDTAQGVANLVVGIYTGNPASIISGIGQAIQGISSLAVAGKIKRANREIARQQRTIENLEYSYQRLEKAQETALGGAYVQNYKTQLKNLEAQQTAYLKQAEAERSKGKKADSDKIKEYEEQARDVADKIADMRTELQDYFAGTDLTSAAKDFANAWIDAYKEFGSTTDAMRKKFDEMIQNMVVNSIAGNLMKNLLKPVFDEIDNALLKDDDLSINEISKISKMVPGIINKMNQGMTQMVDSLAKSGYDIRNTGGELKGISRELATASEESILGLAAGINTQNYYISYVPMIHTEVQIIRSLLQGGAQVQQGGFDMQSLITIQNQHLSYLPNIAANTADTVARCERAAMACERVADNLDRVIKPRGVQSTHVVNTAL